MVHRDSLKTKLVVFYKLQLDWNQLTLGSKMVPGQVYSGKKVVIGYVHFLDATSISSFFFFSFCRAKGRILGLLHTGQTLSHTPSPFHGHLLIFFCLYTVVYCLHLGQHHNPSIVSWPAAWAQKCLHERLSPACTFPCKRLFEIRTRTPPLTYCRILLTGRGSLSKAFTEAFWLLAEQKFTEFREWYTAKWEEKGVSLSALLPSWMLV